MSSLLDIYRRATPAQLAQGRAWYDEYRRIDELFETYVKPVKEATTH